MRRASVLTVRETKTKSVAFKITDSLNARLEALDERLKAEAPDSELIAEPFVTLPWKKPWSRRTPS